MILSDSDRKTMNEVALLHKGTLVYETAERLYLAGMKAGIERAAKLCEQMDNRLNMERAREMPEPEEYAAAIRDLID